MINKIVVNATASRNSGALTILNQFINSIPLNSKFDYIIFINKCVEIEPLNPHVRFVITDITSFKDRFFWDLFGVKKWLKKNNITPISTLSLQNTNFNVGLSCPNFIYYHQSIPFFKCNWNFLKKEERLFWFYKNVYPFFVKMFLKSNTEAFVQLDFIKEAFIKYYRFNRSKVHVVFPTIEFPNVKERCKLSQIIDNTQINCFYPSAPCVYKNHRLIIEALKEIDYKLSKKITLFLTIERDELSIDYSFANVEIVFLGKITYSEVAWMYNNVDVLLFPSYIETLGLPLLEAAYFGLPIFASDLPFAKEVLSGYEGAVYLNYTNAKLWGNKILEFSNSNLIKYNSFKKKEIDSWSYVINKLTGKYNDVNISK